MRIVGISAWIGLSLLAAACTTGDNGPGNNDTRGIQCSAQFSVTGSFTASAPRPADNTDGCWPVGMWTFSAAMMDGTNTCSPAPMPLGQYQFEGDLEADPSDPGGPMIETFKYDTDPSDARAVVKVTEGGSGSCAGELDLYSTDGKQVWVLRPEIDTIDPMSTISGDGEYRTYSTDQWPY